MGDLFGRIPIFKCHFVWFILSCRSLTHIYHQHYTIPSACSQTQVVLLYTFCSSTRGDVLYFGLLILFHNFIILNQAFSENLEACIVVFDQNAKLTACGLIRWHNWVETKDCVWVTGFFAFSKQVINYPCQKIGSIREFATGSTRLRNE